MNSMQVKTGNKVILLVEDNPDDEALTLRAFEKSGFLIPSWWRTMASKR